MNGEKVSFGTNAKTLNASRAVLYTLVGLLTAWYVTLPRAVVSYPKDDKEELRYSWQTQPKPPG